MTRAVGDDDSMIKSLQEVVDLFEQAQNSVFKLMSSVSSSFATAACQTVIANHSHLQDSVPKFMREPKYASVLREHHFETVNIPSRSYSPNGQPNGLPERTMSRSKR